MKKTREVCILMSLKTKFFKNLENSRNFQSKRVVFLLLFLFLCSSVYAVDEIVQSADKLNYWTSGATHTVTVTNNGAASVQVNNTIPTGFSYSSGCTNLGSVIQCDIGAGSSDSYVITSTGALAEYTVSQFVSTTNNTYTGNNVSFIKIRDDELFHTLVEYGRGRGNYFYDTYGSGAYAGSGHTGTGCAYVPNGTLFELNFLHKINNIKQYFGDLSAEAYNATFDCTYPNSTIVREHLITSIVTNTTGAFVSYLIPTILGSWERMGYLGMDFDDGDYVVGNTLIVNCTNISYVFPEAGGSFTISEDSLTLTFRNRAPFVASASTLDTIGNGTQEVIITYNITNNELYTVDDVIVEIEAPPYAEFIGVRGELWGSALDQYRIEKAQLLSGESEIIQLVARFDTSNAPSMSSVDLTDGIKTEYVTCWELNAYNPTEYVQTLTGVGTGSVNMSVSASVVNLVNRVNLIFNIITEINTTVVDINNTVNNIQTLVDIINTTTQDTNVLVKAINSTANDVLNKTNIILNNTVVIYNDTQFISDQLNCNGTNDSPLCIKVLSINQTIWDLYNFSLYLNYTAYNLNITVIENINTSGVNVSVNVDFSNLTADLRELKGFVNCTNLTGQPSNSVCYRVNRIENYTVIINNTINSIYNTTIYFNTSVFGNLTFQDILDSLSNTSSALAGVLDEIQEARAFDEEVVFLITDSFGLQQGARDDFAGGELGSAVNKLFQANDNLIQATNKLLVEKEGLEVTSGEFSTSWVWVIILFILIAGILVFYFFRRVPPKRG